MPIRKQFNSKSIQSRSALHAFTILVWIALASMISACHSGEPLTSQQTDGQRLYQSRCAHCHEENDLALKPPPPQIHGVLQKAKLPSGIAASDAVVRHQIIYGKGKMPSFSGRFSEEQMAALLSYLHTSMPNPDLPAN